MIICGFSPAPTSGFFKPMITNNIESTGAIGGGLTFSNGIYMTIKVCPGTGKLKTYINGIEVYPSIAEYVIRSILNHKLHNVDIEVYISTKVPVGSGFGTSASSAFLAGLLVNELFNLNYGFNEIAYIAHKADILFKTGLGSVCGLTSPGFIVIYAAGAPHRAKSIQIKFDDETLVFALWRNGISKDEILNNSKLLDEISLIGQRTLDRILANPDSETFFQECWKFAVDSGLATDWTKYVVGKLRRVNGLVGVTQAQIGDAVFGMVKRDSLLLLKREIMKIKGWRGFAIGYVYKKSPVILDKRHYVFTVKEVT